jgi:hypothetical protein
MTGNIVIRTISLWVYQVVLLVPVALLFLTAVPRLQSGLAIDAAFPVPNYVLVDYLLPENSYRVAAEVLTGASSEDGQTLILLAEVAAHANLPQQAILNLLRDGLSRSPASSRGWALLAEQIQDRRRAAAALTQSLLLAPYDYFLAGRRGREGALLWDVLPVDDRRSVLQQARLIWSEPILYGEIEPLLMVSGGADLLARAFEDEPQELQALSLWIAENSRGAGTGL